MHAAAPPRTPAADGDQFSGKAVSASAERSGDQSPKGQYAAGLSSTAEELEGGYTIPTSEACRTLIRTRINDDAAALGNSTAASPVAEPELLGGLP